MVDHRIDILELQQNLSKLFSRRKKTDYYLDLIKILKSIELDEIRKNPFQPNDEEMKVFISSKHTSFHVVIALYLILNNRNKIPEILEYQRRKFEYNNLVKKASFSKYFSTNVLETLKLTGRALRIKELDQIILRFNEYLLKPPTENFKMIFFDFKEKWPIVIKELKLYIDEDDHPFIKQFFESNSLVERIRFKMSAKILADLFLRLKKHGVVDNKISKTSIAEWLHGRVMVFQRNENYFIIPSKVHLINVLLNRKKAIQSKRILINLYP